ncbi:hypothetical protein E2562_024292 [Oryza meyeriana var. granulata]|uniref:K-box domain-containing protein n=1 Tax=Oryza meyeriana var. granulata TaxID=110450 RepID=A0A6G1C8V0_9ORYZ|nr:hypothetical protein E2562_024292 [Oryza meyeriana var. granulata]
MEDAMLNLPGRLEELLHRHGSMLPKGADDEIPLIKRDLEEIISIFHGYSKPKLEDHAMVVRCWMKEVRELSYDVEDCIDHYEHASAGSSIHRSKITRRRWSWTRRTRTPRLPERLKQRLWMANKISEFSARAQEALQRHAMYNNIGGITSTATTRYDASSSSSWHPEPDGKKSGNVGIDSSMNKLKDWLTDGEEKLKVVSIVGVGGVGKTTLANELYRKLQWQFECRAFVRTSQKPDMRRILISMLSQVRPHQPPGNDKEEISKAYFDELVGRKIIQPETIERYKTYTKDNISSKTVQQDVEQLEADAEGLSKKLEAFEAYKRKHLGEKLGECSTEELYSLQAKLEKSLTNIRERKTKLLEKQVANLREKVPRQFIIHHNLKRWSNKFLTSCLFLFCININQEMKLLKENKDLREKCKNHPALVASAPLTVIAEDENREHNNDDMDVETELGLSSKSHSNVATADSQGLRWLAVDGQSGGIMPSNSSDESDRSDKPVDKLLRRRLASNRESARRLRKKNKLDLSVEKMMKDENQEHNNDDMDVETELGLSSKSHSNVATADSQAKPHSEVEGSEIQNKLDLSVEKMMKLSGH